MCPAVKPAGVFDVAVIQTRVSILELGRAGNRIAAGRGLSQELENDRCQEHTCDREPQEADCQKNFHHPSCRGSHYHPDCGHTADELKNGNEQEEGADQANLYAFTWFQFCLPSVVQRLVADVPGKQGTHEQPLSGHELVPTVNKAEERLRCL